MGVQMTPLIFAGRVSNYGRKGGESEWIADYRDPTPAAADLRYGRKDLLPLNWDSRRQAAK